MDSLVHMFAKRPWIVVFLLLALAGLLLFVTTFRTFTGLPVVDSDFVISILFWLIVTLVVFMASVMLIFISHPHWYCHANIFLLFSNLWLA